MADIMIGPSRQYNHTQLLKNHYLTLPTYDETGAVSRILVGAKPAYEIWEQWDGGWERKYSYTNADWDIINASSDDDDGDGDGDGDPDTKPPSFPSTGPVFTPLDLTAPNENPFYKYNYPDYAYDTGADFQSQGLLTGYGGADPYQPWSQDYGNEFIRRPGLGGDNLWNYQPPSVGPKPFNYDLSKGPGPKVGFSK